MGAQIVLKDRPNALELVLELVAVQGKNEFEPGWQNRILFFYFGRNS